MAARRFAGALLLCVVAVVSAAPVAGGREPGGAAPASAPAPDGGPEAGDAAPDFALPDQHGKIHRLQDYRGRWLVLYFYPKAFTSGCTDQVCAFRDDIVALRKAGARVVGVSLDEVASQAEFADRYHVPFPLLSDAGKEVARRYGVLAWREGRGDYARRETFLVDAGGTVARRYRDVDPQANVGQVLADIARAGSR
ncbi:MAG: peroxiredoxin [Pseudoxanthomonas sp.]|nr:peroxiredoxin [Pseudoxanthomonas sp.]